MKQFPIKKILILAAILAVPGFLYYLLQDKGKNRYKPLAIYGPKTVAATFHTVRGKQIPDTIYHVLNDFKLINQNADTLTLSSFKGKVILVNLFHTQNPGHGVITAHNAMQAFSKLYEKNKMLQFVSLSIDPNVDTQKKLLKFAEEASVNASKWSLLTGDSTQLKSLITGGLLLDALKRTTNNEVKFFYSNMFVLIDTKNRIRGYYEATNQEALSKLDDEIKVLVAEELRNMRDGR